MPPKLLVDFCSYEASRYAVEHWHYSEKMPVGKLVKIGVWENDQFIGAVIFGRGANNRIGTPYNLKQPEVCELVRVALTNHESPVSKIVSLARKKLLSISPGLRLIISYADPKEGHNGGIYQAMNWVYVGTTGTSTLYLHKGQYVHGRTASSHYGDVTGLPTIKYPSKHKYLYPLDRAMRRQVEKLAKPYPKRASG